MVAACLGFWGQCPHAVCWLDVGNTQEPDWGPGGEIRELYMKTNNLAFDIAASSPR